MTDSNNAITLIIDFSVIAVLIVGIWQFRAPRGARFGNLMAAFALLCAFILVLYRNGIIDAGTVVLALLVGSIAGYAVARAVSMIAAAKLTNKMRQTPQVFDTIYSSENINHLKNL